MRNDWDGHIGYLACLHRMAWATAFQNRTMFIVMNGLMIVQNVMMFAIWFIYFDKFSSLRGWQIEDLATLFGMTAFAFGVAFLLCGGALDIGKAIVHGELDTFLAQPRHALWGLLFRQSRISCLGDVLTGYALWIWVSGHGIWNILILTVMGLAGAIIFVAVAVAINCLPFLRASGGRMTEQLVNSFIILSSYPQVGFGLGMKIVLLTALPAGFIAFVPVVAMREGNLWFLGAMALAAAVYLSLAVWLFEQGLKSYTSGNKMLDVR